MNIGRTVIRQRLKRGFTLIELLVVIAIIGILVTIAMYGARFATERARTSRAQHDIDQIRKAILQLEFDTDEWPGHQPVNEVQTVNGNEICGECGAGKSLSDSESGLAANDGSYSSWSGPYMADIPLDPWGHEYYFDTDYRVNASGQPSGCGGTASDAAVIGSYGPDGVGNNQYNCDDIILIMAR